MSSNYLQFSKKATNSIITTITAVAIYSVFFYINYFCLSSLDFHLFFVSVYKFNYTAFVDV